MIIYDLCVVGAGISGIAVAELATRLSVSCVIIDENENICSKSSRQQHGWFHTGALYSNIANSDYMRTFMGNIEDLYVFYSDFKRMNISIGINDNAVFNNNPFGDDNWFSEDKIIYKFPRNDEYKRAKSIIRSCLNPIIFGKNKTAITFKENAKNFEKNTSHEVESNDRTMRTDLIVSDLIDSFLLNEGKLILNSEVLVVKQNKNLNEVYTSTGKKIIAKSVVFCGGNNLPNKYKKSVNISKSYAPLLVCNSKKFEKLQSFVRIAQKPSSTINLINHNSNKTNYHVVGSGESYKKIPDDKNQNLIIENWLKRLKKENLNNLEIIDVYWGEKNFVKTNKNKDYLYHICQLDRNVYYVNPGKFSLSFSLAVNFIRSLIGHSNFYSKFKVGKTFQAKKIKWKPLHKFKFDYAEVSFK